MLNSEFSNATIPCNQLVQISKLDNQVLSSKYAKLNLLINISVTLIIFCVGISIYFQPFFELTNTWLTTLPYIICLLSLLGLLKTAYSYLSDQHKTYALRELDLHYSSGLLFHKIVSQPITRIQHLELKRGPIERKAGLATLQVFSAGGDMHTFQIPGLPVKTAQTLRQYILQHKDVIKHG